MRFTIVDPKNRNNTNNATFALFAVELFALFLYSRANVVLGHGEHILTV